MSNKQLHFIQCVPGNEVRWWWELFVQLNNFREYGYSDKCRILLYLPVGHKLYEGYKQLQSIFTEARFFVYKDSDNTVQRLINAAHYSPIVRLWCLMRHFQDYPELENDTFFYHDSDVVFLKPLDFSPFSDNNINYLSWTGAKDRTDNYIWAKYFDGKIKDVDEKRLSDYKKRDILNECTSFAGITREIAEKNNDVSGGAQYILKHLNAQFFYDCIDSCLVIRNHLRNTNQEFFGGATPIDRENKGFQSWCADMWAVLWNLWKRDEETQTPKELDFLWSTSDVEDGDYRAILHNAGVTDNSKLTRKYGKETVECYAFCKSHYNSRSPFEDIPYIETIINDPISSLYCNSRYCEEILKTAIKYNLS